MRYAVVTFGCRVNQADSLAIEAELAAAGGEAVSSDRAELVVVNTCSVTASADQGARQTIRRIARSNPGAKIVATGCYATRCADEVAVLPGVTAVVPNEHKLTWYRARSHEVHEGHDSHDGHEVHDGSTQGTSGTLGICEEQRLAPGLMGRTAWTLRVQTGCDQACSYCIIPTTRGVGRSRSFDDIEREVDRVLAAGYKEIAITGVQLGSYGRDLSPRSSLGELIVRLSSRTGADGDRVLWRISSLEPMDFPVEILELETIAPHLHLPLQHASNRILELMKRPYTLEYYADLVNTIRARLPHAAMGSDVIVGFPGETDRDFEILTSYLEQSPLTHLHVFPYSDRPGTVASALPDKVHGSVIKARAQRVREISRRLAERFRASQRGTRRPALTIEDGSVAITDNYFRVPAPPGHARNDWVEVGL